MKMFATLLRSLLFTSLLAGAAAHADVLLASDPTQMGRLSRNGIAQSWDNDEIFPGVINPGAVYHYHTYSFNVGLTNFLQLSIDSISPNTFFSGYQTAYATTNLMTNWLGDAGGSGNFQFDANPAGGADPRFFQIVAALNSVFVLVVNESVPNGGLNQPFSFLVEAYPDSSFNSDPVVLLPIVVAAVPEPSTIALLLAPLALVMVRRRRKAVA